MGNAIVAGDSREGCSNKIDARYLDAAQKCLRASGVVNARIA